LVLNKPLRGAVRITDPGRVIGTSDNTAPEQIEGAPVDPRADVYALGCVLYQALTGEVPFPRETIAAKMFAHLSAPVPSVPGPLDAVIRRALAKAPEERFATAGALGQAALDAVAARPVTSPHAPAAPVPRGIPLPPALASELDLNPFAGRAAELAELERRFALARAGERQALLVSGEAGIGKTRLVAEFARRAHAAGATVLYGRADIESLVPYQPFITALQHYFAHRETLAFPADLEEDLGELARFVPALRRRVAPPREDEPELRRYQMFAAVTRLLAFIAREQPLVFVIDDLQWVDRSTALLLEHVLREPELERLLLLGTERVGDAAGEMRHAS
jgi:hypothetical protein